MKTAGFGELQRGLSTKKSSRARMAKLVGGLSGRPVIGYPTSEHAAGDDRLVEQLVPEYVLRRGDEGGLVSVSPGMVDAIGRWLVVIRETQDR